MLSSPVFMSKTNSQFLNNYYTTRSFWDDARKEGYSKVALHRLHAKAQVQALKSGFHVNIICQIPLIPLSDKNFQDQCAFVKKKAVCCIPPALLAAPTLCIPLPASS
ncbi:hypothetical protein CIB48_g6298 [Xylaria polymorpha]|nr:hypothetical protein CIB48_g6298 [Xylaria polymorpha]